LASAWIAARTTKSGKRHRVLYQLGGRGSRIRYAGSFKTRREANLRKQWVAGELAALRVPDLSALNPEEVNAPTLGMQAEKWRASRVDVDEETAKMHRSSFSRIFKVAPKLRDRQVDRITVEDVVELVAALAANPYKRETVKKSRDALAMALDFAGTDPNPARDKRVKLPKERKAHVPPPLAHHVERVAEALPSHHVLPFLTVDACGPRVSEIETAQVGDLDEDRQAIRVRWTFEKNERYRHLHLPSALFEAIVASLPPREDRDLDAPLFPVFNDAALRTAITRACKATGTPHFAPHGLRRRRGSLHYKKTGSLAEVAELLGDSKRVAADHYVYALTDYREADYSIALARCQARTDELARSIPPSVPSFR
jgi:integrase